MIVMAQLHVHVPYILPISAAKANDTINSINCYYIYTNQPHLNKPTNIAKDTIVAF